MSITDELREWWVRKFPVMDKELHMDFTAIADRIDAEYEKAIRELNNLADACVLLPKDADGKYIRIGDVMRFGGVKRDLTVLGIGINSEHDHDIGVFVLESDDYVWYNARFLRHHHAPTVEDVLREMHMKLDEVTALYVGEAIDSDERDRDEARIFAEYAKRLMLAEGEDA